MSTNTLPRDLSPEEQARRLLDTRSPKFGSEIPKIVRECCEKLQGNSLTAKERIQVYTQAMGETLGCAKSNDLDTRGILSYVLGHRRVVGRTKDSWISADNVAEEIVKIILVSCVDKKNFLVSMRDRLPEDSILYRHLDRLQQQY